MNKNKQLSRKCGKQVKARPKQCFHNAYLVVVECLPGATYVEGFAISHWGIACEHAWVEWQGEIIDPTPQWLEADAVYFPGLRFVGAGKLVEAIATIPNDTDSQLPLVRRFGWDGCESPEFDAARTQANDWIAQRSGWESHAAMLAQLKAMSDGQGKK